MQRDMDKIVFESRREIETVMEALEKHLGIETIDELYDLLDVMSWSGTRVIKRTKDGDLVLFLFG